MAVFAISDLHLAYGIDKPMDIFGERWSNYMQKIKDNWQKTVGEDDFVIVPGDVSWATYLELLMSFREKKTTMSKLNKFLLEHDMHNNSIETDEFIICGTRGWKCPGDDEFGAEDQKIYDRELNRLELSLKSALGLSDGKSIVVAMHYPPFNPAGEPAGFVEIMRKYNVKICIYGHLHGNSFKSAVTGLIEGIDFEPLLLGL